MDVRMLKNKVLLKQHKREEKTAGGIILPEDRQLKDEPVARVIAVGEDVKAFSEGDDVVFGTYAGTRVTIDGEECLILREEDVLGVFQ